jgi:succinyl-CoA synthetase beta subunit
MDLYEYQGKQLFARFGIPVSEGRVALTPGEAQAAAVELGGPVVVKAQVLTGGRGKAGGIKLASTPAEAAERAAEILGLDIRGHVVRTLWIERASDIEREYYFSITFDRGAKRPLFMLTTSGGVDIEEVAETDPDAIARLHIDPLAGWHPWIARELCFRAAIPAEERKQVMAIIAAAYRTFRGRMRCSSRSTPDRHPDGKSVRSTRSSRSTTTRSFATPTSPRCATSRPPIRRSRWRARRA